MVYLELLCLSSLSSLQQLTTVLSHQRDYRDLKKKVFLPQTTQWLLGYKCLNYLLCDFCAIKGWYDLTSSNSDSDRPATEFEKSNFFFVAILLPQLNRLGWLLLHMQWLRSVLLHSSNGTVSLSTLQENFVDQRWIGRGKVGAGLYS